MNSTQCSFIFVHFKEYQFTIPKALGSQRTIPAHDAKLNQHADGWGICSPLIRNENITAFVMKPKIINFGSSLQLLQLDIFAAIGGIADMRGHRKTVVIDPKRANGGSDVPVGAILSAPLTY